MWNPPRLGVESTSFAPTDRRIPIHGAASEVREKALCSRSPQQRHASPELVGRLPATTATWLVGGDACDLSPRLPSRTEASADPSPPVLWALPSPGDSSLACSASDATLPTSPLPTVAGPSRAAARESSGLPDPRPLCTRVFCDTSLSSCGIHT